ncbi:MAG: hypothetical protein M3N08_09200 [Pseudomonadota bacterium]|nr:hypothetical protein [Pseudomonadota bacterium]
MTTPVSNLSLQLQSLNNLNTEQTNLARLNEQLASGQQYDNLTNYDPTVAHNLMSFQNNITQRQAYLASIQTVQTRLTIYDQTMNDMESITSSASSLAASNQSLDPTKVSELQSQVQSYMKQVTANLNQQVGGRYIYAGTRYSTSPVIDLSTLTTAPAWPFSPQTSPSLPNYDSGFSAPGPTNDATAYTKDSVTIDTAFSVQYGVTSTDPAFQQLVAGLQFMNAATQSGVSAATFQTDMAHANSLLTTALNSLQTLHSAVADNQNTLKTETDTQNTDISNLQGQLSDLQHVNITEVGTEINVLQSQLQASYSATASLEQLSILKYL